MQPKLKMTGIVKNVGSENCLASKAHPAWSLPSPVTLGKKLNLCKLYGRNRVMKITHPVGLSCGLNKITYANHLQEGGHAVS